MNKVVIFVFFVHKKYSRSFTTDYFTMFLLPFWALNVSVVLLSMQGQKSLGFHKKYLNLYSEDELRSCGLERQQISDYYFVFWISYNRQF